MSTIDLDSLECVSSLLEKSEWQIFSEVCKSSGISDKRRDALFDAWAQEDFIPYFMEKALGLIIKSLIDKEEPTSQ